MLENLPELGRRLLAEVQGPEAQRLLSAALERDATATMQLAIWYMAGGPVLRDLPAARQWLRAAVEIGHVDAALMEVALTANGSGAEANWQAALGLLQKAAEKDPVAKAHLELVAASKLDANGGPVQPIALRQISASPEVYLLPGFCSPAECRHIAKTAMPILEPARIVDPLTGRSQPHPIRTSHAATINPTRETLPIHAINLRIAGASETNVNQAEPLVVLHYSPGQEYRLHLDALPNTANQRIWTLLIYLNEDYQGGETVFPAAELSVKGRLGDALLFRNADQQGHAIQHSRHAGLPVTSGRKWLATRWIRAAPLDPWAAPS